MLIKLKSFAEIIFVENQFDTTLGFKLKTMLLYIIAFTNAEVRTT